MKYFLKDFFVFCVLIMLLIGIVFSFVAIKNKQQLASFKINEKVTTIFAGDSHVQYTFNDSIIPHSINIGQEAEGYLYTYVKLNDLLASNPTITTVFLGCSYHNISSYYDDYFFNYKSLINYYLILPGHLQYEIVKENPLELMKNIPFIIKKGMENSFCTGKSVTWSFMGAYSKLLSNSGADSTSINRRIMRQYFSSDSLRSFSVLNLKYLSEIVHLCKKRNVQLIFVSSPLHDHYLMQVPLEYKLKLKEFSAYYNIELWDLNEYKMNEGLFLPDGDHICNEGSQLVSEYVAKKISPVKE